MSKLGKLAIAAAFFATSGAQAIEQDYVYKKGNELLTSFHKASTSKEKAASVINEAILFSEELSGSEVKSWKGQLTMKKEGCLYLNYAIGEINQVLHPSSNKNLDMAICAAEFNPALATEELTAIDIFYSNVTEFESKEFQNIYDNSKIGDVIEFSGVMREGEDLFGPFFYDRLTSDYYFFDKYIDPHNPDSYTLPFGYFVGTGGIIFNPTYFIDFK